MKFEHMKQYPVIKPDEPFKGYAYSTATYNAEEDQFYIDYSGYLHNDKGENLTFSEYCKKVEPIHIISWERFDEMDKKFVESMITLPVEIDEERWTYAFEVLPPCRWHNAGGVEVFFVSERITHDLVHWYARKDDKFYHFVDRAGLPDIDIRAKFKKL